MKQAGKVVTTYVPKYASSFWLDRDFDTDFKREDGGVDLTKLAAAQRAIGNFVNIVTGKQIPVVFQSNDSSYTDGERVVIGTSLKDKDFDPAVGLALHEGSHILLTDFTLFKTTTGSNTSYLENTVFANAIRMKGLDPDMTMTRAQFGLIKDLLNWIEDRRIDYYIYTNAPGYRMYYEAMYNKYFNDKIIDTALECGEKCNESIDDYFFHIINFTNPKRKLDALKELRSIWNVIDLQNISRLRNTNDALDVACQVYKLIIGAVKEQEQQTASTQITPSESGSEQGTSMSGAGGDADDDIEGDGDGEGEGEEGDGEDTQSKSLSERQLEKLQKALQKQKDFLAGDMKKTGRLSKAQAATVNALRESGTEVRMVDTSMGGPMNSIESVVIKKLTSNIICTMPSLFSNMSDEYINGSRNYEADVIANSNRVKHIQRNDEAVQRGIILGKQLGRKLQVRDSDRTLKTTRLAAGKIDRRLVSQLGYDNVNVFHRIVTDRYKNYFIHISIDASGSMSGDKLRNAITSAVAIAQAASMTTGIRVQISLRGTDCLSSSREKTVTLYAYDSAHDKMSKIKSMFKYLDVFGCTPEGIAFKSIEKDIKQDAKGDECIFINYSDGEPSNVYGTQYSYNGEEYTRRVINGFREIGMNIISYFIYQGTIYAGTKHAFHTMYGPDAQFIDPVNMSQVSRTVNQKFLEMAE
ncbi:MAG TPA: hypothetical protein DEF82_00465 [Crocinitomicaceae bacterium]|nr:hypothetical protein [Crocinitomicaceae bacterium]